MAAIIHPVATSREMPSGKAAQMDAQSFSGRRRMYRAAKPAHSVSVSGPHPLFISRSKADKAAHIGDSFRLLHSLRAEPGTAVSREISPAWQACSVRKAAFSAAVPVELLAQIFMTLPRNLPESSVNGVTGYLLNRFTLHPGAEFRLQAHASRHLWF